MKAHKKKLYTLLLTTLLITACQDHDIYFQYQQIPTTGWEADSIITFQAQHTDTQTHYNIYLHIRYQNQYPYQNLWLFAHHTPQQDTIQQDTIQTYLTDQYGKPLGTGSGSLREIIIPYQKNITITNPNYQINIKQGMRDKNLKGIQEIGIRIEKTTP